MNLFNNLGENTNKVGGSKSFVPSPFYEGRLGVEIFVEL